MRASQLGLVALFTLVSSRAPAGERWYVLDENNSDHVCLVSTNIDGSQQQAAINEWFVFVGQALNNSGHQVRYSGVIYFDNSRMPVAQKATLWLACPSLPNHLNAEMNFWRVSTNWDPDTDWTTTSLRGKKLTYLYPPYPNSWKGIDITDLYNQWRDGREVNRGLALTTASVSGNVNAFTMPTATAGLRPKLVVQYDTSTYFRFPLDDGLQASRISGYNFGDYWLPKTERCFDGGPFKHTGVDWAATPYDPVYAMTRGTVKYAQGNDPKWGGYVSIQHQANRGIFVSTYTHVIPEVAEGSLVDKGQRIGHIYPATTFTPHLHFQVRDGSYEERISLRGRLPEQSCYSWISPDIPEPQFPENFVDPQTFRWD